MSECLARRTSVLSTLLILLSCLPAQAKTNFAHSLEWFCAEAAIIVAGKIIEVDTLHGPGKSRHLVSLRFKVSRWIKGGSKGGELSFSMRLADPDVLRRMVSKTELLVFLYATHQGYNYKGRHHNLWPLRQFSGKPLLVDLASPGQAVLSATTFTALKRAPAIMQRCRQTLNGLARLAPTKGAPRRLVQKRWLSVPYKTEVHRILYGGSACYLAVPGRLFPRATRR